MNRYLYSKNGVYAGKIKVSEFDSYPIRSTDIKPPSTNDNEVAVFNGLSWSIVNPSNIVKPVDLSAREFKERVAAIGKFKAVNNEAGKNDMDAIDFEYRDFFNSQSVPDYVSAVLDAGELAQVFE